MAWLSNRESQVIWGDQKGPLGGFTREPPQETAVSTGVGPVSSPNGNQWFIVVDNAGLVKTEAVT